MTASSFNELFGLGSHSTSGLAAWYLLQDDAASTAVIDSAGSADGTLEGGNNTADLSTTGPSSYLTKALDLDGTADRINVDGAQTLILPATPLSILARVRLDSYGLSSKFYSRQITGDDVSGSDVTCNFRFGNGTDATKALLYAHGANRDAILGSTNLSLSTWYDVAFTRTASGFKRLYVDGVSDGVSAASSGVETSPSGTLRIGDDNNRGRYWDGQLCDISYWTVELANSEIQQWGDGPEPINTVAPVVSGTESVGSSLSSTSGTWGIDSPFSSGSNGTITYAYQWTRSDDGAGTNEADISGATSSNYTLVAGDLGKYIRCRIRATNDGGFDAAADTNSNFTGAIASGGGGWKPHFSRPSARMVA